jgi:hypothetical protein
MINKAIAKTNTAQAAAQAAAAQPVIQPPDGSGYTPPSSTGSTGQGYISPSIRPDAGTDVAGNVSTKKIPWLLVAGVAFFVIKVFIMKKATSAPSPAAGV